MIQLKEAVVVEGKYDKIKLDTILDTLIIPTNGFAIHKDKERLRFIKKIAAQRGIVVLTDSDHAGFQIRSYLNGAIPQEQIRHAYIPDVFGKERRKNKPSKEGKLGVEGVATEQIIKALEQAGVLCEKETRPRRRITTADLFNDGFTGTPNSKARRKALFRYLDLPEFLSTHSFLQVLNGMLDYQAYRDAVSRMTQADQEAAP